VPRLMILRSWPRILRSLLITDLPGSVDPERGCGGLMGDASAFFSGSSGIGSPTGLRVNMDAHPLQKATNKAERLGRDTFARRRRSGTVLSSGRLRGRDRRSGHVP
jgi:hypothetical protein